MGKGLIIETGGEGDEGKKVNLKICLAGKVIGESTDHYTKEDC
jgi:hypothetical protein